MAKNQILFDEGSITQAWVNSDMGQAVAAWVEDAKKAFQEYLAYYDQVNASLSKYFQRIGRNIFSAFSKRKVQQVQQSVEKLSGTVRRSVMSFDQLNRLTKNSGLSKAAQNLGALGTEATSIWEQLKDTMVSTLSDASGKWNTGFFTGTLRKLGEDLGLIDKQTQANTQSTSSYNGILSLLNGNTLSWTQILQSGNTILGGLIQGLLQSGEQAGQTGCAMSQLWQGVTAWCQNAWNSLKTTWQGSSGWFSQQVVQPTEKSFSGFWDKLKQDGSATLTHTKTLFGTVSKTVSENLSQAWKSVYGELDVGGKINTQLQSGVLGGLKAGINGVIQALNTVAVEPFQGLNNILDKIQNMKIGNLKPFSFLSWRVTTPKIPQLARGAVLPANKPFLAMVGDQRHGTNIEAPLSTIEQAVSLSMEDVAAQNMAGHAATVAVLRDILQAVLGISIGDSVIAAACDRHRSNMSVVYGK